MAQKRRPRARQLENDETREDVKRLKRLIEIPRPDPAKVKEELVSYFQARMKKREVVTTTRTPQGQVLDWVPIESQVRSRKIASPPSESVPLIYADGKFRDRLARFELEDPQAKRGPQGTVPKVRKNLGQLRFTKVLKDYLSKHGHPTYHLLVRGDELEAPGSGGGHEYAYTSQSVTCYGG